ncbi:MAG: prepilin-type N-terminal cleavage/methylation domain-containing protein [Planctomycetota bacterium]
MKTVVSPSQASKRHGFTLVEVIVALVAGLTMLVITSVLFTQVRSLTIASDNATAATGFVQGLERQLREDLSRLATDHYMVIRQSDVTASLDGANITVAADQIMFFAKGEARSARVGAPSAAPSIEDRFQLNAIQSQASETPQFVYNPLSGSFDEFKVEGSESRVWYGHLITPDLLRWTEVDTRPNNWPIGRWTLGRHQLVLLGAPPAGLREQGSTNGNLSSAAFGELRATHAFPHMELESFVNTHRATGFGGLSLPGNDRWQSDGIIPPIWSPRPQDIASNHNSATSFRPSIGGRLWGSLESLVLEVGADLEDQPFLMADGGNEEDVFFYPPIDMAYTSLAEIRAFLRPADIFSGSSSNGELISEATFQRRMMRESCYRVHGMAGWDLLSRSVQQDADYGPDFTVLPSEIDRDGVIGPAEISSILSNTVIPFCSSFRVEFAADLDGDGQLDKYAINKDDDGNGEPDPDAGEVIWYGDLPGPAVDFGTGLVLTGAVSGTGVNGGPGLPEPILQEIDSGGSVALNYRDYVFGYPEEMGTLWPWMLRVTVTLRDESGRLVRSPAGTNEDLLDHFNGDDLEAYSARFIVELPRAQ